MLIPRLHEVRPYPGTASVGCQRDLKDVARRYPYPSDGVVLYEGAEYSTSGLSRETQYTVTSTERHNVRLRVSEHSHTVLKMPVRLISENDVIGEVVHLVDSGLKDYLTRENPRWGPCLHVTCSKDASTAPGMLVMIDKMSWTKRWRDCAQDQDKFSIRFDLPRIERFTNIKRCVYVEEISMSQWFDPHPRDILFCDFVVTIRDDTIGTCPLGLPIRREFEAYGYHRRCETALELSKASPEEIVALESLRETVSEDEWKRYIKRGFILVRGSNGREYQLFRDKWHAKVRVKGKVVAEICSRLSSTVPPTDNVIAFKTMIEVDENQFEKAGNVYKMEVA